MELALNLIGGHGGPPESLVKVVGGGLGDELGDVEGGTVLNDLPLNKLGKFGHGVVGRAVELKSLANGALVVQHQLKGVSDLGGLEGVG